MAGPGGTDSTSGYQDSRTLRSKLRRASLTPAEAGLPAFRKKHFQLQPEALRRHGACEEQPRGPPGWARVGERRRGWGAEGASVPGGRQPAASLQCSVFLSCPRSFLETSQVGRAGRCLLPAALTAPRRVGSRVARVCMCGPVCVCERVCADVDVCVRAGTCLCRRACGVGRLCAGSLVQHSLRATPPCTSQKSLVSLSLWKR